MDNAISVESLEEGQCSGETQRTEFQFCKLEAAKVVVSRSYTGQMNGTCIHDLDPPKKVILKLNVKSRQRC